MNRYFCLAIGLVLLAALPASAANSGMTTGTPDIKSAGPLAFGPDGILFVGDPKGAAIFAIDTQDTAAGAKSAEHRARRHRHPGRRPLGHDGRRHSHQRPGREPGQRHRLLERFARPRSGRGSGPHPRRSERRAQARCAWKTCPSRRPNWPMLRKIASPAKDAVAAINVSNRLPT